MCNTCQYRIAVDPVFPPPIPWATSKKFLLPDNPLENNKFEMIFDERQEGLKLKKLFKEVSITENQGEFSEIEEQDNEEESSEDN